MSETPERAGTWQPVEDGEYDAQHTGDSYIVDGEWLAVRERILGSEPPQTDVATIALPDGYRLCEFVPAEPEPKSEPEQPQCPECLGLGVEFGDYSRTTCWKCGGTGRVPSPAEAEQPSAAQTFADLRRDFGHLVDDVTDADMRAWRGYTPEPEPITSEALERAGFRQVPDEWIWLRSTKEPPCNITVWLGDPYLVSIVAGRNSVWSDRIRTMSELAALYRLVTGRAMEASHE